MAGRHEMTKEDIEEFKDCFQLFDTKGDNKVQGDILGNVMRALGFNPTEAVVKNLAGDKLDAFVRVSWEEFLPMLTEVRNTQQDGKEGTEDDFYECFKVFDKEDNGNVSAAEMHHVLCTLAERLKEEELEPIFNIYIDPNGNLRYEEFIKHIMINPIDQ